MIGGIYFLYEGLREKPEFLPPQDRWQITEVTYGDITDDVGRQYTCFRMKYLDENYERKKESCVFISQKRISEPW